MLEIVIVFLCGLFFGSFANVCIYRMPKELSIVKPRSQCPECGKMISWHDNIPVFSYIFLKAKCRRCGSKISVIYPLIEIICAVLFLLMYFKFGFNYLLPGFCLFAFSLLVITAVDFKYQIIPDEMSLLLVVAGFLTSFFNYNLGDAVLQRLLGSFLGFLAGGGILYIIAVAGKWFFKQDAMGGGDIKLMAGVGTFIGWEKVLFAIFIASMLGSIVGITLILFKKIMKKEAIAFGPYLAAGSLATLFLPPPAVILNAVLLFEEHLILSVFYPR